MADILGLHDNYPTPDDDHSETFKDLDGKDQVLTIEHTIPMASNAVQGHHPFCGMPDCEMVESMQSQMAREMARMMGKPEPKAEMIASCYVYGPTTPERMAFNKKTDVQMEKQLEDMGVKKPHRRVGFDINRDSAR